MLHRPLPAFVLDLVLVLVFATIGRATHEHGLTVTGVIGTAWPFLLGTAIGWGGVRLLSKAWPLEVGPGVTVWLATVVFGMLLRGVSGGGIALPFVLVAAGTLALLLVGWRALLTWRSRGGAIP
ncbi:MAG: DUF3054 domain-containing protein [Micrococcales bacterium]|nr:DUF3054 domain-containing protein [Micrococcales bacterium]